MGMQRTFEMMIDGAMNGTRYHSGFVACFVVIVMSAVLVGCPDGVNSLAANDGAKHRAADAGTAVDASMGCLLYTSPSPRD